MSKVRSSDPSNSQCRPSLSAIRSILSGSDVVILTHNQRAFMTISPSALSHRLDPCLVEGVNQERRSPRNPESGHCESQFVTEKRDGRNRINLVPRRIDTCTVHRAHRLRLAGAFGHHRRWVLFLTAECVCSVARSIPRVNRFIIHVAVAFNHSHPQKD
jgi:hypothetical protein